jgi:hypothetical protein
MAERELKFPDDYQFLEKNNPDYRQARVDLEARYLELIDRSGLGSIQYLFDKDGLPYAYRRIENLSAHISPKGAIKKYIQLDTASSESNPTYVWFSPNQYDSAQYPRHTYGGRFEEDYHIGSVRYLGDRLVVVNLGNTFLKTSNEDTISQGAHFFLTPGWVDGHVDEVYGRMHGWDEPADQSLHFGNGVELFDAKEAVVFKIAWESQEGVLEVVQTYLPGTKDEISKIIQAPFVINHKRIVEAGFAPTPEKPLEAKWPFMDSILPVHMSFSGPGFTKFMGVSNE